MPVPSFPRSGISKPDADLSAFAPTIVAPAQTIRVGATCDTPGASLTLAVHFVGSAEQPLSVQRVTFTAPGTPDVAAGPGTPPATPAVYVGTPPFDSSWPLGGSPGVILKVDVVTAGTWTIDAVKS